MYSHRSCHIMISSNTRNSTIVLCIKLRYLESPLFEIWIDLSYIFLPLKVFAHLVFQKHSSIEVLITLRKSGCKPLPNFKNIFSEFIFYSIFHFIILFFFHIHSRAILDQVLLRLFASFSIISVYSPKAGPFAD